MCAASRRHPWTKLPREELLDVRLCDLKLSITGTPLEAATVRVRDELRRRDLRVTPYFWLSDDWFTPGDHTGVALPFYLAHPRLARLERSQIGEVEGGNRKACLQFLRHELGHVVDHAFQLRRRRRRQQLFGLSSHSYPRFYRPNPYSKRHVQHLEYWYAQSHPDEDFAETFAVWLTPRSRWRVRYQGWPALKKLEYVDELMAELAGQPPLVRTRDHVDSLPRLRKTLRQHYRRKSSAYNGPYPDEYDHDLRQVFSSEWRHRKNEAAAVFIRRNRADLLRLVGRYASPYQLEHVLREVIGRSRELKLRVVASPRATRTEFALLLTKHAIESLFRNRRWVEM